MIVSLRMRLIGFMLIAVLLMVLVSGSAAFSQETTAASVIYLQSGSFDPLQGGSPDGASVQAAQVNADGLAYALVQFVGPVELPWVQQVEALGGQVLGYVPDNTHVVRLALGDMEKIASLPSVRWVGFYQPEYKLAPALQALSAGAGQEAEAEFSVIVFPGTSSPEIEAFLQSQGATIEEAGQSGLGLLYRIRARVSAAFAMAQQPDISWIEPYITPTLFNEKGRKIIGAEAVWEGFGYFGAGQIVAISDSGLSVQGQLSADFDGRLIRAFAPSEMNIRQDCRAKTNFTDLHGHGTHVAGSVLGNGTRSGSDAANHLFTSSHAGVAPEARLVFMALNTDGSTGIQCVDLNGDFIARGYEQGARISSNSWGGADAGGYNLLSSVVDDFLWRHKDYLVLFAAGNARPGPRTVGSPGTAKNILTVGASENNRPDHGDISDDPDTVTSFSSRGPTADGRIKPDVVTPGSSVLSVKGAQAPASSFEDILNSDYAFMSGTSMATPLTAGGAALVREWAAKTRNIANPSGALLKAIMINGAATLPGAATPNNTSGYGRTDLKNTLNAQYAIIDDHVQGLQTGQSISYTVQIVGTTSLGVLAASTGSVAATLQLQAAVPPVGSTTIVTDAAQLAVEALPGHLNARSMTPLPTTSGADKASAIPLTNPVPPHPATRQSITVNGAGFQPLREGQEATTFLQHMVGGGDFEDPDWTDIWQDVWLGYGIPERTDNPALVINGNYSVWLGGTPSEDSIWYPLAFPDQIDTSQTSFIEFNLFIFDQNPGVDRFCAALVDASSYFIGPYAPNNPECADEDGIYTYSYNFTPADLGELAGQTGYLVLYNEGDGAEPHLSAIVDDVALVIDFPDVTLESAPTAGPPGTTFLLTGQYNVPYGAVDICIQPCSDENYIKTVYADDRGDIAAYLYSQPTIAPGTYPIEAFNTDERRANTTITIAGGGAATLSVTPPSGAAGTPFDFSGSGFIPNDNQIAVTVNGESLGTTGSNASGEVAFSIDTQSNTPPGQHTVEASDSAGNSATTTFEVTALNENDPSLSVAPTSGPAGTIFTFTAQNFTPSESADVTLDGQSVGQATIDATGGVTLTLETTASTAPGVHTLIVSQGNRQASAQFEITGGGGGGPQSGNGLHVTLTWTDPPAQASAAKTLVNDLDLIIDGPGGRIFGNGGANPDRTNNVEGVRLDNLAAGTYVITVRAQSVNGTFGAQPYALVATTGQNFEANTTKVDISNPNEVGAVSGAIFLDENQNGAQEASEAGIADAGITATNANTGFVRQTVSTAAGSYSFASLPPGSYIVAVTLPPAYVLLGTNTATVQVTAGNTTNVVNAIAASIPLYLPLIDR